MKQFKTNSEKDIIQYTNYFFLDSYFIILLMILRYLHISGAIFLDPSRTGGRGDGSKVLESLFEKLGSFLVMSNYFRSKSVCMIAGNSVKSIIYVSINGVGGWAYSATYCHRNSVLCSQDTSPSIIYYTFYRISGYHAYRFRSEIF